MSATTGGHQQGPIGQVREGMTVVDSAGDDIGTVRAVRLSDPGVDTGEGQETGQSSMILDAVAHAFGSASKVPEGLRERLVRLGYVQIDATGLFAGDKYASAEDIAEIRGDVVHLGVDKGELAG